MHKSVVFHDQTSSERPRRPSDQKSPILRKKSEIELHVAKTTIFLSCVCLKSSHLFTHKFIMSKATVDGLDLFNVPAYNVKLREMDYMQQKKIDIIKTPITKEGKKTGKFRYRLAGVGSDGTGMSRFINQNQAEEASAWYEMPIEERAAKTTARKKKSCKQIGEDAEERCSVTRTAKKPAAKKTPAKKTVTKRAPAKAKAKKAPAKKAPAKKAPAKKAPAKKPAAKKAGAKKK